MDDNPYSKIESKIDFVVGRVVVFCPRKQTPRESRKQKNPSRRKALSSVESRHLSSGEIIVFPPPVSWTLPVFLLRFKFSKSRKRFFDRCYVVGQQRHIVVDETPRHKSWRRSYSWLYGIIVIIIIWHDFIILLWRARKLMSTVVCRLRHFTYNVTNLGMPKISMRREACPPRDWETQHRQEQEGRRTRRSWSRAQRRGGTTMMKEETNTEKKVTKQTVSPPTFGLKTCYY